MAWFDFFWTDEAIDKIAEHGLTTDDVEFVIRNPSYSRLSRSSGREMAFGWTESGDWIVCVYEAIDRITIMPITAYRPTKAE